MFIAELSTIAKLWREPKCSLLDEWKKKMWYQLTTVDGYLGSLHSLYAYIYTYAYVYTHTRTHTNTVEYYSAIKNNEILPFAKTWMDLRSVMLSKISQSEKDKYHM
ncbi:LORF2 protein, partial [Crocuta crocuta]